MRENPDFFESGLFVIPSFSPVLLLGNSIKLQKAINQTNQPIGTG
jgi:hypothetical protein